MSFVDDFLNKHKNDGLAERVFRGLAVSPYIRDIANLRLETLKDFPCLYEGDFGREIEHLERIYLSSSDSWFLLYLSGAGVVGCIAITPLVMLTNDIKEQFIINGLEMSDYMYIGEAMLRKEYRGRGLFRNMLTFAEKQAKEIGKKYATFSCVERENMNNTDIKPENLTWEKFGYQKVTYDFIEKNWMRSDSHKVEANKLFLWEKYL